MVYTADWPTPPADALVTVQLVGDCQTSWEQIYPVMSPNTAYDAMGHDLRDRLIVAPPQAVIQMGDINDSNADFDLTLLKKRFNTFARWLGDYGLETDSGVWWKVMGNHDVVGAHDAPPVMTAQQWAAFWGYSSPSYTIDLGRVRVIVLNPTGTGLEMSDPTFPNGVPVRPLTTADVTWLDQRLAEDSRPTLLAVHAPLDIFRDPAVTRRWQDVQATVAADIAATDLLAVLNTHHHCIGWLHGHTHNPYALDWSNTQVIDIGSRNLAVVDAGAVYTRPNGDYAPPTTFYVSVLDDGLTLDVRWRSHHKHLWDAIGPARYHRLTAT